MKRKLYSAKRDLVTKNPEKYRYTVAYTYPMGDIKPMGIFESKWLAGKAASKLQKRSPEANPRVKIISASKGRSFMISKKQKKELQKYRKNHPQKTFRNKTK